MPPDAPASSRCGGNVRAQNRFSRCHLHLPKSWDRCFKQPTNGGHLSHPLCASGCSPVHDCWIAVCVSPDNALQFHLKQVNHCTMFGLRDCAHHTGPAVQLTVSLLEFPCIWLSFLNCLQRGSFSRANALLTNKTTISCASHRNACLNRQ